MAKEVNDRYVAITRELSATGFGKALLSEAELVYRPVPNPSPESIPEGEPIWRIRLDLAHDPSRSLGLDINGEVLLGRGDEAPGIIGLSSYDAEALGVSRRHALLRPTETHLFLLDLGSTNGTWQNGHSIGVNMPYRLAHGDRIRLGRLEFEVKIVKRPKHTAALSPRVDWLTTLVPAAQAITSQLDFGEVLNRSLESIMMMTSADEASMWLVDEQTGELFLEASRGIEDDYIKRMRLPVMDTLAGKAIETGKPLHVSRNNGGTRVKVKTGYLVEAVIYVPLILGGVPFGVLSVAHHKPGSLFSPDEERLIAAVADLTAVAVQNSRLYEAATKALSGQTKMITAVNYALSYDLKNSANSVIGYAELLSTDDAMCRESTEIAEKAVAAGNQLLEQIGQLLEITKLNEAGALLYGPCDLVLTVRRAVRDMEATAQEKAVRFDFNWTGGVYMIWGDSTHLYLSARALLENAVLNSPPGTSVRVQLDFGQHEVSLKVSDAGPVIPEEDLSQAFDKYSRSGLSSEGQTGIELGLALARATAEAHRGTASARNLDGQGVMFAIMLPATIRLPEAGTPTDPRRL
jgi:signal transduction histidine kinase